MIKSWLDFMTQEAQKEYFIKLNKFLANEIEQGKTIFPKMENWFAALSHGNLKDVKVVILGQDPYFNIGQADGLAFSVQKNAPFPPALHNIFKELKNDLGIDCHSGDLTPWAKQGVLLLNTHLTVEEGLPLSHSKIGWEIFTHNLLRMLNENFRNLVFLLWGKIAQNTAEIIDEKLHLKLINNYKPIYSEFLGCGHFSKTNEHLKKMNVSEIDWRV